MADETAKAADQVQEPVEETVDATDGGQEKPTTGVTFSPEQQETFDRVLADRLKRARAKWEQDQQDALAKKEAAAEEQRLKDQQAFKELSEKQAEQITALQAQIEEHRQRVVEAAIQAAIREAADKCKMHSWRDAYRPEVISACSHDPETGEVTGALEAVQDLVKDNKHLVKPEAGPGTSTGGVNGRPIPAGATTGSQPTGVRM